MKTFCRKGIHHAVAALAAFTLFLALGPMTRAAEAKRLLIVGQGGDGHPPMSHEFMAGARVLEELLKPYQEIHATVVKADEPWNEGPALIDKSDGLVLFVTQGAQWMQTDAKRFEAIKRLAARGGALVAIHWSVGAKDAKYIEGQLNLLGGTRGGPQRKYKVLEVDLQRVASRHPILTGVPDVKVYDEMYYALDLRPDIQPLFKARVDGEDHTVVWAWERNDGGRSFGFVPLHFHANWQLPEYRRVVVQSVLWTLKFPIPAGGVKTDINPEKLTVNGVLPPVGPPARKSTATGK